MRIPVLNYEPSRARVPLWGWIVGEHGAEGYVSLWNARSRASAPCVGDEERDSRNELLLYWVPSLSEAFRLFRRYCPPSTGREFMPYIVLGICRHLGLVAVMVPE